jgi:phosphoribosylanthranilate isomerase
MSCSIKICGVTTVEDALMVSESGADYLGVLVNVSRSPRSLTREKAKTIFNIAKIPVALLTFDLPSEEVIELGRELKPFAIQLAGNETEKDVREIVKAIDCEIWKTLHIPVVEGDKFKVDEIVEEINNFVEAGIGRIVLDSAVMKGEKLRKGGTGQTFDWSLAGKINAQVKNFIFLAGGITPDNVKEAILQVKPGGIDLSSGVESSPGKKDLNLVKRLMNTVRDIEAPI